MRREILGVGVDVLTMDEALARADILSRERRGAYVCTPNPEMVWACRKDERLRLAVNGADMALADGVGVVWAARVLGQELPERVTGADFAQGLLDGLKGSLFLLGGRPGVAQRAAENIGRRWPGIRLVGCCDGYFEDEAGVFERVRQARPDVLLVCMGTPRQELLMQRWAGREEIGLMAGLGGTLDLLAGDVRRAPAFYQKYKLEWLYRLGQQPRRILRLGRLPLFVLAVWKQRITHGKGKTDCT